MHSPSRGGTPDAYTSPAKRLAFDVQEPDFNAQKTHGTPEEFRPQRPKKYNNPLPPPAFSHFSTQGKGTARIY
jgi:hypothetical protein